MTPNELIQTLHPVKRKGIVVNKQIFAVVAQTVLSHLHEFEEGDLLTLINLVQVKLPSEKNVAWFVYNIKLDLEARGLIKAVKGKVAEKNLLSLTTKGKKIAHRFNIADLLRERI